MKKVLHYVGKMDRGGMETFIMNLYRNIDTKKVQFDFAVHTEESGDFDEEIVKLGGKIIIFPSMRKNPLKYSMFWEKFWKLNGENYLALHFHTNSLANIIALKKSRKYNVPIRIVHSHSSFSDKGKLQLPNNIIHNYHMKRISDYANKYLACSEPAADWLFGESVTREVKVDFFKNGIDIDEFSYNSMRRQQIRNKLELNGKIVIGHVGKFIDVKNHEFLIDVFSSLVKLEAESVLLLVGDGKLLPRIKQLVIDKNLQDKVIFMGVRDDVNDLLQAMDVFILPSLYEGLPFTLVEAQASGIPILVSANIAKEVKIKDNLIFKEITASSSDWATSILSIYKTENRVIDNSLLIDAGYSVKDTALNYLKILK